MLRKPENSTTSCAAPAPKDLPPPGVALPDWWVWKVVSVGWTDVQRWNCDFSKRGIRSNRAPAGRPAVTLVNANGKKTWHYLVVFGNVELSRDDGRRLGWSHILDRPSSLRLRSPRTSSSILPASFHAITSLFSNLLWGFSKGTCPSL